MKNVRNSSKTNKVSTPTKTVKRLQPNSLWEKLEPTLPLPKKRMKFKSPYKRPQIQLKIEKQKTEKGSSAITVSKDVLKTLKTTTVKIKPIDPFKFTEALLKNGNKTESNGQALPTFKRSLKAQSRVNHEVLALIQKTAETIKMIRKQNEEWKTSHQEMRME